eukprot:scaffold1977_cov250-Skeletonema_marinoi.AAC.1
MMHLSPALSRHLHHSWIHCLELILLLWMVIESGNNIKLQSLMFIDVDFRASICHLISPSYAEHDLSNSREQSRSRYDRKQDWLMPERCVHGPQLERVAHCLMMKNWKRSKSKKNQDQPSHSTCCKILIACEVE